MGITHYNIIVARFKYIGKYVSIYPSKIPGTPNLVITPNNKDVLHGSDVRAEAVVIHSSIVGDPVQKELITLALGHLRANPSEQMHPLSEDLKIGDKVLRRRPSDKEPQWVEVTVNETYLKLIHEFPNDYRLLP